MATAQPVQQEQITSTIPSYATPYAQMLLGNVFGGVDPTTGQFRSGLATEGYEPYRGQTIAGFTPLQQQAMEGIAGMQVAPELGAASGLAALAGRRAGMAGRRYERMATDPYAMQSYMSPYMQNVVEQQKREAMRDYARQIPGLQAQGIRSGARGGTREALLQSEAQRNLQQQLQGLQATGLQNAYQQAQQAQQFGANLGMSGLQQQLAASQALGGLGGQRFQQQAGIGQAQLGAGGQMQALEQQLLNQQYQDFINKQQFPYKQAEFGMGILRGIPTQSTSTLYQQPGSLFGQIAGVAGGLGSLFGGLGGSR
jgi:hypothetical protein